MIITRLEFTLQQAAILKQMAEAWERHLQSQLLAARRKQQEMAISNTELDLREVDKILAMLGRPRITTDPKLQEPPCAACGKVHFGQTRRCKLTKFRVRDDIIDA